jgi:serine protease Do
MRLATWTLALTIVGLPTGAFAQSAREEGAGQPDRPPREARPEANRVERRRIDVRLQPGVNVPGERVIGVGPGRNFQIAFAGAPMEKGAWLGLNTSPPPHVLRQQLQLPRGVGLVVDMVAPDSPAQAAGVKQFDVLHKLNDQILINQQQLAVLIRTFKPGDEVKLTVIRDGKPQELTAKLVEKELRPVDELRLGAFGGGGGMHGIQLDALTRDLHEQARRLEEQHRQMARNFQNQPFLDGEFFNRRAPGANLMGEDVTLTWDDGSLTLTLSNKDGKRHLVAKDKTGKVLHDGPIDTEEQRKALPEPVRKKLESTRILGPGGGPLFGPREGPSTRPSTRPARPGAGVEVDSSEVLDSD